jgi:hypothetical protein
MSLVKTTVINYTDKALGLKEGNAGMYRHLTNLEKNGGQYKITCNTNATYREYCVVTDIPDNTGTTAGAGTAAVPALAPAGSAAAPAGPAATPAGPASAPAVPAAAPAGAKLIITSDDCVEYKEICIRNGKHDPATLELDKRTNRDSRCTELVNCSGGTVQLKTENGDDVKVDDIPIDQKVTLKCGAKGTKYWVVAGDETIKISNKKAAKTQAVKIITKLDETSRAVQPGKVKLDMVPSDWFVTEVVNKTSAAVKVKYSDGHDGTGQEMHQENGKWTIEYDPKKVRTYAVEYFAAGSTTPTKLELSSKDFEDSRRIEVNLNGDGKVVLKNHEPRPHVGENGIIPKVKNVLKFFRR